jgi:hypothetical protein
MVNLSMGELEIGSQEFLMNENRAVSPHPGLGGRVEITWRLLVDSDSRGWNNRSHDCHD